MWLSCYLFPIKRILVIKLFMLLEGFVLIFLFLILKEKIQEVEAVLISVSVLIPVTIMQLLRVVTSGSIQYFFS